MADPDADRRTRHPHQPVRPGRKRAAVVPGVLLERIVLDVLAEADVPLGAYALAAGLRARGRTVPMPSIYRALDRLVSEGTIQRVETRSAYRIRDKPEAVLMVCVQCGRTTSLAVPHEHRNLVAALHDQSFAVTGFALEATGRCAACGEAAEGGPGAQHSD